MHLVQYNSQNNYAAILYSTQSNYSDLLIAIHILSQSWTCQGTGYHTDLCEYWWLVMCNHSGIFTVKRDCARVIVEGFFWLHHMIVQFFNSTFKYATKVPWNQVSSYCWKSIQKWVSWINHQSGKPRSLKIQCWCR